jgi:ribokinase
MIYVLGSINADLVVYSDEFPKTGETIVGKEFFVNQGGKGANQAIAARKAGAETTFIGRTGKDYFGEIVVKNLVDNDVTLQIRKEDDTYTGIALINVNSIGENKIIIIHGANSKVNGEELTFLEEKITGDDILMLQGEIDSDILLGAAKIAKNKNATVIFDPAPVNKKLRNVIPFADFITPNEVEIKSLAEKHGTEGLFAMGAKNVIKKLGEKGIFYEGENGSFAIPAFSVRVVDTTGAGDTFNGAFAAALSEGKTVKESIIFGVAAAAISVTRKGAASSFPSRGEIEDFLLKRKNI